MQKLLTSVIAVTTILTSASLASANPNHSSINSNDSTLISQSLSCGLVETFGNRFQPQLLNLINGQVAGQTKKINRRKKLRINHVEGISFSQCRMNIGLNVTLKRKIRRDAHGTVKMTGNLTSFDPNQRRVCYSNLKINSVKLSRTLKLGEKVYQWAANKALPNRGCFDI